MVILTADYRWATRYECWLVEPSIRFNFVRGSGFCIQAKFRAIPFIYIVFRARFFVPDVFLFNRFGRVEANRFGTGRFITVTVWRFTCPRAVTDPRRRDAESAGPTHFALFTSSRRARSYGVKYFITSEVQHSVLVRIHNTRLTAMTAYVSNGRGSMKRAAAKKRSRRSSAKTTISTVAAPSVRLVLPATKTLSDSPQ